MTNDEFGKLYADFTMQLTDIMLEKAKKYYAEHPEARPKSKHDFKKTIK